MADCRLKYINEIHDDIYNIIGIGRTSAIPNKPNSILLPVGGKDNENKSLKTKNNTYYWAQRIQEAVNSKYNSDIFGNLITIDNESSNKGTIVNITIPTKLIDAYEVKNGQKEYEEFLKEHETRMAEGNQRVTDEGDVLYGMEAEAERSKEDVEFHINTITVVSNFLEKIGVPIELSTFDRDDVLAAANFMKMSVQVAEDMEKRPSAWNKLPEEAAHFWYRLLDTNSPLKDALLQSAKTTHKEEQLRKTLYGKVYGEVPLAAEGKYELSPIREEAIGQLIAEAIKRIEQKNGSKADYNFFQAFLDWINSILKAFRLTQDDPFEVAAIKILAHDKSDLLTIEEYKQLNKQIYFGEDITNESIEKKNVINEVIDPTEQFFNYLVNGQFKKKTRYLQKTLKKYYTILEAGDTVLYKPFEISNNKVEFIKQLKDYEKATLVNTNNYTNITPSLKGLSTILTKYKKQPISLNQEFKLEGVKKNELEVYNSVLKAIKEENPTLKSISSEEFVNEVYNFLKTNYLLGFAAEREYLSYRVSQTFTGTDSSSNLGEIWGTMPTEQEIMDMSPSERQEFLDSIGVGRKFNNDKVKHRKISLRFNDTYFKERSHFDMSPSAWGNLTPFNYISKTTGEKEIWIDEDGFEHTEEIHSIKPSAVLLHEIQNDNIEKLKSVSFAEGTTIEETLNNYINKLKSLTNSNIKALETGGYKLERFPVIEPESGDNFLKLIFKRFYMTGGLDRETFVIDAIKQEAGHRQDLYRDSEEGGTAKERSYKRLESLYSKLGKAKHIKKSGGLGQYISTEEKAILQKELDNLHDPRVFKSLSTVLNISKNIDNLLHNIYQDKDLPIIHLVGSSRKRKGTNIRDIVRNLNSVLYTSLEMTIKGYYRMILNEKKYYIDCIKKEKAFEFAKKVSELSNKQIIELFTNYEHNLKLLEKLTHIKANEEINKLKTTDIDVEKIRRHIEISEGLEKEALLKVSTINEEKIKEKEENRKILERELNYFTPLVHHLIQTHIKDYGKDTPLYFSGYGITMLTQGNKQTASIYAGPEEVKRGLATKVGPIWTAMNNISGIKLEYVENIEGLKDNTGGYKVNLDNYSYQTPILYGLDTNKPTKNYSDSSVNYALKAVNILSSNKAKQIFEKGEKNKWDLNKILSELAIPKEQKEIILSLGKTKREDIITDLLANYSYTVEINTAKTKQEPAYYNEDTGMLEGGMYERNSEYYSYLAVPGGTNYTENEISTPLITPSIKGHAQFSTDKGIGWFRSDELELNLSPNHYESYEDWEKEALPKTRRILEIQSDLFQKGRDRKFLISNLELTLDEKGPYTPKEMVASNQFLQLLNKDNNWVTFFVKSIIQDSAKKGYEKVLFPTGNTASKVEGHATLEEFKKQKEDRIKGINESIKELKKDFDKKIKYFESSSFKPKFNTRLDALTQHSKDLENLPKGVIGKAFIEETYSSKEDKDIYINSKIAELEDLKNELAQYKKELERVETEGFGALKPIFNFYENTVTNILKKQGYNPTSVTDEYGNTWNEVNINPIRDNANILLQTKEPSKTVGKKNEKLDLLLKEYLTINGIHLEYLTTLLDKFGGDYTAAYHRGIKEVISINSRRERKDTLAEEVAHSLVEGLGEDDFLVNKALNLIGKTDYKSTLDPQYIKLYKNNEKALKKEYLGKLIAEVLVHRFEPTTPTELTLLQTILKLIDKFLSMFKPNDRVEQIEAIAGQLANKIINKEKIVPFGTTTPDNTTWFQVDEKKPINEEYKRQYVYFKRRIGQINTALDDDRVSPERKIELKAEQEKIKRVLDELRETDNIQLLIDLGEEVLNKLDVDFIRELENNTISVTTIKPNDLIYAIEALKALDALTGTSDRSKALYKRLVPFIKEFIFNQINKYATEEQGVSKEAIEAQITDINRAVMSFGALVDSDNYIARTVGAMVKEAQNTVSTENKHIANKIKEQVDKLREFSASRGISEKEMYKPFIQEYRGTTILTMPYTTEFYDLLHKSFKEENKAWRKANAIYNKTTETWSPKSTKFDNPNYKEIFKKGNEPMAEFYNFHKETIKTASKKLPRKIGENFIANLARNTFVDILKGDGSINDKLKDAIQNITEIDSNVFDNTTLVGDEDLMLDKIPLKFLGAVPAKDKSNDLGENLLTFASFATSYKEMSEVLPKARLFQEQLKTKSFIKSSDPETRVEGEDSNIFNMVKTYINMQVKGEDKNKEFKVSYKDIYDEDGNKIGEKYVHMSDFIDFGLRYNSLLRIGLNPFNAVTNVFVGDIGNIIEGFGARFYTLKDLKSATNIFFSQINKKESELNKWLEKLNPLQELEDYENVDKVALKKGITPEKVKDKMYSLQRMGETFLQTRTMTAILIKDGYLTPEGITTEKGAELTKEQLTKLSNKVQRVNQMIHGRYSQRDAAIVQQSVLWRMALQFKKWIPAAIESRVQSKKYDNRLGTEVEGRYRTYAKWFKLAYAQLKSDKAALEKNQFTELDKYNMRKNLAEITIALATLLMYTALGWDDDKKKKQNPYYKFTMNQLNRISGDILFFYSPTDMNRIIDRPFALVKTTGDLLDVIETLPYAFGIEGSEYKRGIHKGENKFIASLIDVTPTAKPVADIFRLTKKVAYEEPNK